MAYKLNPRPTRENAHVFHVYYSEATGRVLGRGPSPTPERPIDEEFGVLTVGIRPLLGEDSRAIADMMVEHDRKGGKGRMRAGTVVREKFIRSVVFIDTIEDENGNEVKVFGPKTFASLRNDLVSEIVGEIDVYNGEAKEEEDEGGNP